MNPNEYSNKNIPEQNIDLIKHLFFNLFISVLLPLY